MALTEFLSPRTHSRMELWKSNETREEGYTPGLRVFQGEKPNQAILLNATYNNYTITNHFRSKEQVETNTKLKKTNKAISDEAHTYKRKYEMTKKLLRQAAPLVRLIDLNTVDEETRKNITHFNALWDKVEENREKRKHAESNTMTSVDSVKKRKTQ